MGVRLIPSIDAAPHAPAHGSARAIGVGTPRRGSGERGLGEKHRVVVMLRWVLMIALSYLVVFSARGNRDLAGLCVAVLLASNLVLMRVPPRVFHHRAFDVVLVGVDVALITTALWLCGRAGPDFFFMFFFVVFIAALGERVDLTAIGALLASAGYLFLVHRGPRWTTEMLIRLPFFFVTALTYGYLAWAAREARSRARSAEEVLRLKMVLLGTVSHEMRSPLNVIAGYTEMLASGEFGALTGVQRGGVDKITVQCGELRELVDRSLDVSHLDSGAAVVRADVFALPELLDEVRIAVVSYHRPGVALTVECTAAQAPLCTDRMKLKEVLTNLLTNALKYTDAGTVTLSARPAPDDAIALRVHDTGIGITPEARAVIFEPFTRAPEAETRGALGVGLGLYIVRRLVDLLGGTIVVESVPGVGSTFTVTIPRALAADRRAA